MSDLNVVYTEAKFWLPMTTLFGIVIRAYISGKNAISDWADKLLNNHLHSIESSTKSTLIETQTTNALLRNFTTGSETVAKEVAGVKSTLADHHEKQAAVWQAVTESLVILKERSRANETRRARAAKKARKATNAS